MKSISNENRLFLKAFLVLASAIILVFACIHFETVSSFCSRILTAIGPILTGLVIAYIFNPLVDVLTKKFIKKKDENNSKENDAKKDNYNRRIRGISAIFLIFVFLSSIAILGVMIIPEFIENFQSLFNDLPQYVKNITEKASYYQSENNPNSYVIGWILEKSSNYLNDWLQNGILDNTTILVGHLASGIVNVFTVLYNLVVGLIIAVYVLIDKERFIRQFKKFAYYLYAKKKNISIDDIQINKSKEIESVKNPIIQYLQTANNTFSAAIFGKFIDSLIIGIICAIVTSILGIPYSGLISVIVGVTNMIPFVGPFIGAVPCALLVLITSPIKSLYFVIFILILQQFDCNFLDPKIVGHKIGLPAFWEIFACLLGGGLFGLLGMLIGVPLFAIIYNYYKNKINAKLDTIADAVVKEYQKKEEE